MNAATVILGMERENAAVECPACDTAVPLDRRTVGDLIECPNCHAGFRIQLARAGGTFSTSVESAGALPEPSGAFTEKIEIRGVLGRGGQGTVYRVRPRGTSKDFALKFLDTASAAPKGAGPQDLSSELSHPNIVGVFATGVDAGRRYALYEIVEGRTLSSKIAEGPLNVDAQALVRVRAAWLTGALALSLVLPVAGLARVGVIGLTLRADLIALVVLAALSWRIARDTERGPADWIVALAPLDHDAAWRLSFGATLLVLSGLLVELNADWEYQTSAMGVAMVRLGTWPLLAAGAVRWLLDAAMVDVRPGPRRQGLRDAGARVGLRRGRQGGPGGLRLPVGLRPGPASSG